VQLGLEVAKCATAIDRPRESSAGPLVADALSEICHVLVPHARRQRVNGDQIEIVQVNGVVAVDAGVFVQNTISPVSGLTSHRCS
jgi:hypothetical protein